MSWDTYLKDRRIAVYDDLSSEHVRICFDVNGLLQNLSSGSNTSQFLAAR